MDSDDFGIDFEKIRINVAELVYQKMMLYEELLKVIKTRDSRKVIEMVAENTADDIDWVTYMRHMIEADPGVPLGDIKKEELKQLLFRHLGLKSGFRPSGRLRSGRGYYSE